MLPSLTEPPLIYCPPPHRGLDIVAEDPAFLVVAKPAGLLSVPGRGDGRDDCLASRVQAHFPEALIVHRLDMATSGLLVLARGEEMQRRLSRLFRERQVAKRYIALVAGRPPEPAGRIELPLIADWPNRPRQKVDHAIGKPSLTHYRVLGQVPELDACRVELLPITGRSHQLRVHMLAIGHPILGDELYAPPPVRSRAGRLMLHAEYLAFPHPGSGEPVAFSHQPDF